MIYKRITSHEAKEKLSGTDAILVDIRDEESFKDGHVETAVHLTQEHLPLFLDSADKSRPVMVMCYHGNSSQMVADFLVRQGFMDVYSIDGGYEGWYLQGE